MATFTAIHSQQCRCIALTESTPSSFFPDDATAGEKDTLGRRRTMGTEAWACARTLGLIDGVGH